MLAFRIKRLPAWLSVVTYEQEVLLLYFVLSYLSSPGIENLQKIIIIIVVFVVDVQYYRLIILTLLSVIVW